MNKTKTKQMKKFLLLLHEDIETMKNLSPKEMEAITNAHMAWARKLSEEGYFISGDGLKETGVQISGKESVIKDGPYLESKEMIGGYFLVQGENLEAIIEITKECPCHLWGGTTEIRPIMDYGA